MWVNLVDDGRWDLDDGRVYDLVVLQSLRFDESEMDFVDR